MFYVTAFFITKNEKLEAHMLSGTETGAGVGTSIARPLVFPGPQP